MINLIVHAKYQKLITGFFNSLLPTIDARVKIYAVTEGLDLPDDSRVVRVDRTEFRPGKYFNIIMKELAGQEGHLGIINDDIIFHPSWYGDVLDKLKMCYCVSPGFAETQNHELFLEQVEKTKDEEGIWYGMHDAFSIFPIWMAEKIMPFDENATYWYDISYFLQVEELGYKWVTSRKVTIQHLYQRTLLKEDRPVNKIGEDTRARWGRYGQLQFKKNSLHLRRIFRVKE